MRIMSKKLRDSARGEPCTLNIAGVCNYDSSTVVLCHLPDESHGMGRKSDDIVAAFGCHACHDAIDGRAGHLHDADAQHYAQQQTDRIPSRGSAFPPDQQAEDNKNCRRRQQKPHLRQK